MSNINKQSYQTVFTNEDAIFIRGVLDAFIANAQSVTADDGTALNIPSIVAQINQRLDNDSVSYTVAQFSVIYNALGFYLNNLATDGGNEDVAEKLFFTVEKHLDGYIK